jgi:hypothetical protein
LVLARKPWSIFVCDLLKELSVSERGIPKLIIIINGEFLGSSNECKISATGYNRYNNNNANYRLTLKNRYER